MYVFIEKRAEKEWHNNFCRRVRAMGLDESIVAVILKKYDNKSGSMEIRRTNRINNKTKT